MPIGFSIADENPYRMPYDGFEFANLQNLPNWKKVNVPHNWDQYEGYQSKACMEINMVMPGIVKLLKAARLSRGKQVFFIF